MSNKFGWAIGGALAATLLAVYGFQANVVQTAEGQHGIRILMALAPAVGTIAGRAGHVLLSAERSDVQKIQAELAVVRAK